MQTKEMIEALTEGFCLAFPFLWNITHLDKYLTNWCDTNLLPPGDSSKISKSKSDCPIFISFRLLKPRSVFGFSCLCEKRLPSEIFNKILLFLFLSISLFTYNNDLAEAERISQESFNIHKQAFPGQATSCLCFPDTASLSTLLSQVYLFFKMNMARQNIDNWPGGSQSPIWDGALHK